MKKGKAECVCVFEVRRLKAYYRGLNNYRATRVSFKGVYKGYYKGTII